MRKIVLSLGLVLGLSYLMPQEVSATSGPGDQKYPLEIVITVDKDAGTRTITIYKDGQRSIRETTPLK